MNFEFDENQQYSGQRTAPTKTSFVTGLIMKSGLAKNTQQATLIQIVIVIVLFLFIGFMAFGGGGDDRPALPENIDPATGLPYGVPAPR